MREPVHIGILGDYDPASPTLPAVQASLEHAAAELGIVCQSTWLATDSLEVAGLDERLQAFDGLWAAPGSPYRSFQGMLRGIEFARRRNWPFVGT